MERIRRYGAAFGLLFLMAASSGAAFAQGVTNGTLRGRVTNEGQGLPGVTVTVKSPVLQGERAAVTTTNGDYVFVALPPGSYTVTYTIQAFRPVTKTVDVSAAQQATVDAVMSLAGVEAVTTVVGKADTVSTTTQNSQTFTKELSDNLPISRTMLSTVTLAAGVNTNGPNSSDRVGNGVAPVVSISGAQSFDNLFTVDGAVVTDNIRGTPFNLFVEDAIAETTTTVSSVSAEFGRFTGGVINTVTKSGGNTFSGSFRTTVFNDAWSATTPSNETRIQKVSPQYEATLGGPVWKDHVWFFGSGRLFNQTTTGQTTFTNLSYPIGDDEKRYQGKLTLTPVPNHTLAGSYLHVDENQTNSSFCPTGCLDLDSLVPSRLLPEDILTLNYNGVITNSFFVEALYSQRNFTFKGAGSPYTDLIRGTLLRDLSRGRARYNSPTFCGVCDDETRDNRDYLLKGTYFLSTPSFGSHNLVAGYDNFAGKRKANNYQSGSNYRLFTTSAILQNGDVFPVFDSRSYIYYTPINRLSSGSDLVTHSVFVNDSWRLSDRLSFNLGVRYDKNHAADSRGFVSADDNAFSPRVAASWDVKGDGRFKVGASYAKYVGAIQENQVDSSSDAGSAAVFIWYYEGAPINTNANGPLTTRADAIQQVFNYFFAQGCPNLTTCRLPLAYAQIPGLNRKIPSSLKSPNTQEYVFGFTGALGSNFAYRVDGVRREFHDFYALTIDGSTGSVPDGFGNTFDVGFIQNTEAFKRNYTGLHTSLAYRLNRLNAGVNWTWSHTLGNINGEAANAGPTQGDLTYPEYKAFQQFNPYGSLATDQRHRVRLFATYDLPIIPQRIGTMNVSVVQSYDTGRAYGAVGLVNAAPFVAASTPRYQVPPTSVNYYFTNRDAFRTDDIKRTDLALNFSTKIAGLVEFFLQPQVLNLFNNQGVIGVDTSVRTAVNAARFLAFNPFTATPVQGPRPDSGTGTTNWDFGPNFGRPRSQADYQLPRTFTLAAGIRF